MYQRLDDLIESVLTTNSDVKSFETSIFNGEYITGDVSPEYLSRIRREREDASREPEGAALIELHRRNAAG